MTQDLWSAVDRYFAGSLLSADAALEAALGALGETGGIEIRVADIEAPLPRNGIANVRPICPRAVELELTSEGAVERTRPGLRSEERGHAPGYARTGFSLPRLGAVVERYQGSLRELRLARGGPLLLMVSARAVPLLSLAILARALGASSMVRAGLTAGSVHMVATSAGDLVPGQLGVTDAAFALAAPALGLSLAAAVAVALLSHGVQLVWCAAGALTPLLWHESALSTPARADEALISAKDFGTEPLQPQTP